MAESALVNQSNWDKGNRSLLSLLSLLIFYVHCWLVAITLTVLSIKCEIKWLALVRVYLNLSVYVLEKWCLHVYICSIQFCALLLFWVIRVTNCAYICVMQGVMLHPCVKDRIVVLHNYITISILPDILLLFVIKFCL